MTNTDSLIDVATQAARAFQSKAGRDATQLEIAQLVADLRGRLIIWQDVPLGAACIATWRNLH